MPIYRYCCPQCRAVKDEFRTVADRNRVPECHGPMQKVIVPPMVSVFQTYTTAALDKEQGRCLQIGSRAEHEAFLRRNGYEEVGDDKRMAPLSAEELNERQQAWADEPTAPMVDVEQLQREGWISEDLTT